MRLTMLPDLNHVDLDMIWMVQYLPPIPESGIGHRVILRFKDKDHGCHLIHFKTEDDARRFHAKLIEEINKSPKDRQLEAR